MKSKIKAVFFLITIIVFSCNRKADVLSENKKIKNSISNKKLDINLYYKFSSKIPRNLNWYSICNNKEFIPTFTKKIFKQVENLY